MRRCAGGVEVRIQDVAVAGDGRTEVGREGGSEVGDEPVELLKLDRRRRVKLGGVERGAVRRRGRRAVAAVEEFPPEPQIVRLHF